MAGLGADDHGEETIAVKSGQVCCKMDSSCASSCVGDVVCRDGAGKTSTVNDGKGIGTMEKQVIPCLSSAFLRDTSLSPC